MLPTFQMTPSSTTKNVRDIISAVENMYESVNSSATKSHEIDQVLSLKQEFTQNGFESNGDKKDISKVSPRLSEIVLNTMAIQGNTKHKCEQDLQVPEPPRRSKPRNNKTNAKNYSTRNSNSSLNISSKQNNDNTLTPSSDEKSLADNPTSYNDAESKCNNNTIQTTSGRPTAMDLAVASNGGKRSMWGELREVVESGVLGMIHILRKLCFSICSNDNHSRTTY